MTIFDRESISHGPKSLKIVGDPLATFIQVHHRKHQLLHPKASSTSRKASSTHLLHSTSSCPWSICLFRNTSSFTWRTHLFISTSRKTWRTHLFRIISWKTWTTAVLSQIFHRKHEYSSFSKHDLWKKLAKSFVSRSCTQTCFWVSFINEVRDSA